MENDILFSGILLGAFVISTLLYRSFASNRELRRLNKEANETAKMLIRRDLELTEANARLQELDVVKSEFVSVAAHQLRTPLTGIRWSYLALLEKENGPLMTKQLKIIEGGLGATVRIITLVNDLLNVARIEEGKFGFDEITQSIAPIMEKVYATFSKIAEGKGIKLLFEMQKETLPLVSVDGEKIEILLDNLIDNAIKYTSPGGEVRVRVAPDADTLRISVKDTGIGILKEQQRRVFTKFFRGDNAQLFQTSGAGLGLYVARNIAEKHGGTLTFESIENKGTTFIFTLPIANKTKAS